MKIYTHLQTDTRKYRKPEPFYYDHSLTYVLKYSTSEMSSRIDMQHTHVAPHTGPSPSQRLKP